MDEVNLPTVVEIDLLPRLAKLKLAARCADRAHVIFRTSWLDLPEVHALAIDRAIGLISKLELEKSDFVLARSAGESAFSSAEAAARTGHDAAAYAAEAIGHAALCLLNNDEPFSRPCSKSVRNVAYVATKAGVSVADIRNDYHQLYDEFFVVIQNNIAAPRSYWSRRVGDMQNELSMDNRDLVIHAFLRDGVDPTIGKDKLLAIYNAMNEYSIAKYGKAITIKDFQEHVMAGMPAGVCG